MSITHRKLAGHVYLVEVNGPLNVTHAGEVNRYFVQMAGEGIKRVVVNLAEVPFIDGPGLKALLIGYKLFGRENFRLVNLQDQPQLVLEVTGFDHYFQVLETIPDAKPAKLNLQNRVPAYVPPLAMPERVVANPA
jgi:anti-anti-sigma factor